MIPPRISVICSAFHHQTRQLLGQIFTVTGTHIGEIHFRGPSHTLLVGNYEFSVP